ncbi:MAG: dTDP-4-amino-4,6-dideoxygalactose transaminase [Eubacterium sp.]|nr:dTDP-4-amino-4,6-dideoxygalactose transaminase [Eubacterium sp.]
MRIDFNRPPFVGNETEYIRQAVEGNKMICGDGPFTKKCSAWMRESFHTKEVLLTTSCTHALEMASYLAGIGPGDEVIMPSYTFVSTADAFVLRGATCVFVDIHPETMNIDETKIEDAITEKTKAIVPVHYAGVSCAMDEIMAIAEKHHLKVIEDAAQGVNAWYKGKALGTIGDFGCYSFHETKNYSMGEGGALLFQDESYLEKAEILREKGTNRSKFFRGQIDKYTWVDYGSSYLPSDMNAAYLWAQLEEAEKINQKRLGIWNFYHEELKLLADRGLIEQPFVPDYAEHNAHMYYLKVKDLDTRTRLLAELKQQGILSVFHYVPLHSAEAGRKFGRFHGEDVYTTRESERIMRLPMYYSLSLEEAAEVVKALYRFFEI